MPPAPVTLDELRALLTLYPAATLVLTDELDLEFANAPACLLLPFPCSNAETRKAHRWLPKDSRSELLRRWNEGAFDGSLVHFAIRNSPETTDWVGATARELMVDGQRRLLVSLRRGGPQLTEQVDASDYRRIKEAVATQKIGIYQHDHLSETIFASGELRAQYGLSASEELSIESFAGATHPDDGPFLVDAIKQAHDPTGHGLFDVEHRILTPEGEVRWLHTRARTRFVEDSEGVLQPAVTIGSVQDITETTKTAHLNSRFAAMMEAIPDLVAMTDLAGNLSYLNRFGRELAGIARAEDLLHRDAQSLLHGSSRQEFSEKGLPTALREGVWRGELMLSGPDDAEIPVLVVLLAHKQTRSLGAYLSILAHDLSPEKSLEAQLLHSQKLEAVGRLAGGVAHDFNNLLSVIMGFSALAANEVQDRPKTVGKLAEVRYAAERAAELTTQLLSFSRKQVLKPRIVDVNRVFESMTPMMLRLVTEQIDVNVVLDSKRARIRIDPGQLEQVLMNLVVNARDAIDGEGHITVEAGLTQLDDSYAAAHRDVTPGPHVVIAVSDTGSGMDEETQKHIFEPFFTTKGQGQGTGLGLSTVFGIVKQSGGTIWVYSELGHGTTFKIYFPATDAPLTVDEPEAPPSTQRGGLILMVEDDSQLRKMLGTALEQAGYTVLAPTGPVEALAVAKRRANEISLLLTDVVMPQMTGKQLADALLTAGCDFPVLYMSGYTENSIVHHGVLDEGVNFLAKPVTPERLTVAVARAIGSHAV